MQAETQLAGGASLSASIPCATEPAETQVDQHMQLTQTQQLHLKLTQTQAEPECEPAGSAGPAGPLPEPSDSNGDSATTSHAASPNSRAHLNKAIDHVDPQSAASPKAEGPEEIDPEEAELDEFLAERKVADPEAALLDLLDDVSVAEPAHLRSLDSDASGKWPPLLPRLWAKKTGLAAAIKPALDVLSVSHICSFQFV